MIMDGVFVEVTDGELPEQEIRQYLFYLRTQKKRKTLETLKIKVDGDYVELTSTWKPERFERIRRITGWPNMDSPKTA